jgi:hypothetical protein
MNQIKISRPKFPKGYVDKPTSYLSWEQVNAQLTEAKHYWLCSTRPDGRPHVIPRWGVFIDNNFYYDGSPETRHAHNIAVNPHVIVHLESGEHVVILEGTSEPAGKPDSKLAHRLAKTIGDKYSLLGYSPESSQWDEGGLFVFTPRQCIAWSKLNQDPTKFIFKRARDMASLLTWHKSWLSIANHLILLSILNPLDEFLKQNTLDDRLKKEKLNARVGNSLSCFIILLHNNVVKELKIRVN